MLSVIRFSRLRETVVLRSYTAIALSHKPASNTVLERRTGEKVAGVRD